MPPLRTITFIILGAGHLFGTSRGLNLNVRQNANSYGPRGELLSKFGFTVVGDVSTTGRNLQSPDNAKYSREIGPQTLYEFMMNEQFMFGQSTPTVTKEDGSTFNLTIQFRQLLLKPADILKVLSTPGSFGLPQADHPMCNHPNIRCNPGPCSIIEINYNNLDLTTRPAKCTTANQTSETCKKVQIGDGHAAYSYALFQYGLTNCGPVFGRAINTTFINGTEWSYLQAPSIGDESFYHAALSIPDSVQPSENLPDVHRYAGERAFKSTFTGLFGKRGPLVTKDRKESSVQGDSSDILQTVWRQLNGSSAAALADQGAEFINVPLSYTNDTVFYGQSQTTCKYRLTLEAEPFQVAGILPESLPSVGGGLSQQWVDYLCDNTFGNSARAPYYLGGKTAYHKAVENNVPFDQGAFMRYALESHNTTGWASEAVQFLDRLNDIAWDVDFVINTTNMSVPHPYLVMAACCIESPATFLPDVDQSCDVGVAVPPKNETNSYGVVVERRDAQPSGIWLPGTQVNNLFLAQRGQTCQDQCSEFGGANTKSDDGTIRSQYIPGQGQDSDLVGGPLAIFNKVLIAQTGYGCNGGSEYEAYPKTKGYPYIDLNRSDERGWKCFLWDKSLLGTSDDGRTNGFLPTGPHPELTRQLCACKQPAPCRDMTRVVHSVMVKLRACCPWYNDDGKSISDIAALSEAGRCLTQPDDVEECASDNSPVVRPGGFVHEDYSFWASQTTSSDLKMSYTDYEPDSDNIQKAAQLKWTKDAALLQRRLRATSKDDFGYDAYSFFVPLNPVIIGKSQQDSQSKPYAFNIPYLENGTTWVPDWSRPSRTQSKLWGSARGASFMMNDPYSSNLGTEAVTENQMWDDDCYGCNNDTHYYTDECGKAQRMEHATTPSGIRSNPFNGQFPDADPVAVDPYDEQTPSPDYKMACSAMGWGCYDEVYRCNIHNTQRGTLRYYSDQNAKSNIPGTRVDRAGWLQKNWWTNPFAKWSDDMLSERQFTPIDEYIPIAGTLRDVDRNNPGMGTRSFPVCSAGEYPHWHQKLSKAKPQWRCHPKDLHHKGDELATLTADATTTCTTFYIIDATGTPNPKWSEEGFGWQLHRSVPEWYGNLPMTQLHADPDFATIMYQSTSSRAETAMQCPAFSHFGYEVLYGSTSRCMPCWDGIFNNTVGETGTLEIVKDENYRQNHGFSIRPDWVDTQKADFHAMRATLPPSDLQDTAPFPPIGCNQDNVWKAMQDVRNWLSFSSGFQSKFANYNDHVGERCESARSMYHQNRAPWSSTSDAAQAVYGTGCGRRASGANNWDPFVSSRGIPTATLQLLNWAKYGCLNSGTCTLSNLPPWGIKTYVNASDSRLEDFAYGKAMCWFTKVTPGQGCADGMYNRSDYDSTLYAANDWSSSKDGNRDVNATGPDDITERLRHNVREERGDNLNPWVKTAVSRRWKATGLKITPTTPNSTYNNRRFGGCVGYMIQPSHYFDDGAEESTSANGRLQKYKQPFLLTMSLVAGQCNGVSFENIVSDDVHRTSDSVIPPPRWFEYAELRGSTDEKDSTGRWTIAGGNVMPSPGGSALTLNPGGRAFYTAGPCIQYAKRKGYITDLDYSDRNRGVKFVALNIDSGCELDDEPAETVGCKSVSIILNATDNTGQSTWRNGSAYTDISAYDDAVWNADWLSDVLDPMAPRRLIMPIDVNNQPYQESTQNCPDPNPIPTFPTSVNSVKGMPATSPMTCAPCVKKIGKNPATFCNINTGVGGFSNYFGFCYAPPSADDPVPGCVFPAGMNQFDYSSIKTTLEKNNLFPNNDARMWGYCITDPPDIMLSAPRNCFTDETHQCYGMQWPPQYYTNFLEKYTEANKKKPIKTYPNTRAYGNFPDAQEECGPCVNFQCKDGLTCLQLNFNMDDNQDPSTTNQWAGSAGLPFDMPKTDLLNDYIWLQRVTNVPGCIINFTDGIKVPGNICYNPTTGPSSQQNHLPFRWEVPPNTAIPLVLKAGATCTCGASQTSYLAAVDRTKAWNALSGDTRLTKASIDNMFDISVVGILDDIWMEKYTTITPSTLITCQGASYVSPWWIVDIGPQAYGKSVHCAPTVDKPAFALVDGNAPYPLALTQIKVTHCVTTGAPRQSISVAPPDLNAGVPGDYPRRPYFQNNQAGTFACDCTNAKPIYGCLRYETSASATIKRTGVTPPPGMEFMECGWAWSPTPAGTLPVGLFIPSRTAPFRILERDPLSPINRLTPTSENITDGWVYNTWITPEGPNATWMHLNQRNVSGHHTYNDFSSSNDIQSERRSLTAFPGSCIRPPFGRIHANQMLSPNLFYTGNKGSELPYQLSANGDEALIGYCENVASGGDVQYQFCDNDMFSPDERMAWCQKHADTANFILTSWGIGPRLETAVCNYDAKLCVLLPDDPGPYGTLTKIMSLLPPAQSTTGHGYTIVIAPFSFSLALTLRANVYHYNISQPTLESMAENKTRFHSVESVMAQSSHDNETEFYARANVTNAKNQSLFVSTEDLAILTNLAGIPTSNLTIDYVTSALIRLNDSLAFYIDDPDAQCNSGSVPAPSLNPNKNHSAPSTVWECVPQTQFLPVIEESVVIEHQGISIITVPNTTIHLEGSSDPAIVVRASDVTFSPLFRSSGAALVAYGPSAAGLKATVTVESPGGPRGQILAPVSLLGQRYIDVSNVDIAVQAPRGVYAVAVSGAYTAPGQLATLTSNVLGEIVSVILQDTNGTAVFTDINKLNTTDLTALVEIMGIERERTIYTHAPAHRATLAMSAFVLISASIIMLINIVVVRQLPRVKA